MKRAIQFLVLVFASLSCGMGIPPAVAVGADNTEPAAQPAGAGAITTPGLPTVEDIQAALDKHDYSLTVRLSNRLLALRGAAAEGIDRYQVLRLKAEGLFGAGSVAMAADCEIQALKETVDPHEIALAKSTALLFRRSHLKKYVPKTAGPGGDKPDPIDLLDLDHRKDAMGALLNDELAVLQPRIRSANSALSLIGIIPVLQQVQDLQSLDLIANGDDTKTMAIAGGLDEHARVLITTALKGMGQRVDDLDKSANQSTTIQNSFATAGGAFVNSSTVHKSGLSESNKDELNQIRGTCDKIVSVSQIFTASEKDDKGWAAIISDANRVSSRAKDVLDADYSDVSSTNAQPGTAQLGTTTGVPNGTPYVIPTPKPTPTK
jgi:hypothetical protein